ncbi:hypothetical protein MTR_5g459010 [Medicago truncatula]|uniref:Uncharacterized protein n=1 Tax=Medicago truncatula TaxID=3880 RepID=A0A072UFW4_MEDTR|nr:hypothetical protein MTR_5g459010 [Medicago truncatula]
MNGRSEGNFEENMHILSSCTKAQAQIHLFIKALPSITLQQLIQKIDLRHLRDDFMVEGEK